jgi:preprotein translocase subunit SecF
VPPNIELIFMAILMVAGLVILDWLLLQRRIRRARRHRLEARIDELERDAQRRIAERPTMNTRGRAP